MGGYSSAGSSFSGYELVEEKTVTGAAVTTLDFDTVLTGDTAKEYLMQWYHINATASNCVNRLRINGADWAVANSSLNIASTTVSGSRGTDGNLVGPNASEWGAGTVHLLNTLTGAGNSRFAIVQTVQNSLSSNINHMYGAFRITTPANTVEITSLGISSSVASSIGIGSVIRLYRRLS